MKKVCLLLIIWMVKMGYVNAQFAKWQNEGLNWNYNFNGARNTSLTNPLVYTGTAYNYSSPAGTSTGWLPAPSSGEGYVSVSGHSSFNGFYQLSPSVNHNSLNIGLTEGGVTKFAIWKIPEASEIARFATRIEIGASGTSGRVRLALGNTNTTSGGVFTSSSNVSTTVTEASLFAMLQWSYSAGKIQFAVRKNTTGTNSSSTYQLINDNMFTNGSTYDVEVFMNNSSVSQTYTYSAQNNTIPARAYHIWVNGTRLNLSGVFNFPTAVGGVPELAVNKGINSFGVSNLGGAATADATFKFSNIAFSYAQSTLQQRFVDFNSSIPANWVTSSSAPLSLSSDHIKGGGNALKWVAGNGNQLKAFNLGIPSAEISSTSSGSCQIFVYNPEVSNDTLIFQFYDNTGVKRREGKMLLNYKGWRDYHRSYYYDYNNGNTMAGFVLSQCNIIYKPQNGASVKTFYIDEARFIGDAEVRIPGPHMVLDYHHFRKNNASGQNGNALESWLNTPDIPVTTPASNELTGLSQVRTNFLRTLSNVNPADLAAAKAYVQMSAIGTNTDGSIKGRGLTALHHADTLVMLSTHCGNLARAYIKNGDTDARDKLLLFTEYLLDQGLAEGGRNVLRTNSYANARNFPVGFLEALNVYTGNLKSEIIKMLKWSHQFNIVYGTDYIPGYNVDFLNLKSKTLFELALAEPDDVAVRDLKSVKRFMERNTAPSLGGRDGIKPDGLGYHHQSPQVSYMTAWGVWIDLVYQLRGTVFKINQQAYDNMSLAIKTLFLATSKGTVFSHAESGRTPFQNGVPISLLNFRKFVEIGGDIKGLAADPEIGGLYNYITGTSTYSVPLASYNGFYQFNYGAMGVHRKNNWTVVTRGFTNRIFGSEINEVDNRWGRYQSYGSLEVLYGGNLSSSGYIRHGNGWDWNVMPGTTTVHFPDFTGLLALRPTSTEFQLGSFAGSSSLGRDGIFGMDFSQNANYYATPSYTTSNLKFRKSVFAFDSILVCLGSTISTSNSLGNVATNLFQAINASTNPAIYINSISPTTGTYNSNLSTASSGIWLLNAQTTGYYIPQGNGNVTVFRGSQSTPLESSNDANVTATANASKAWINHGTQPSAGKYQFVVVPETTPQNMQSLASQFSSGNIYQVLKQTDTLHAVKYLPDSTTSYVFFLPQSTVNVGYIKSISSRALVGVIERGDTIKVTVTSPDLKTISESSLVHYWLATESNVDLVLNGNWNVVESNSNVSVSQGGSNTLHASFTLMHGFSSTITLVKSGTPTTTPGIWESTNTEWNYNLGTGTGTSGTAWTSGVSLSSSSSPGFLPYPPLGTARVSSSSGTPRFDLQGTGSSTALKIAASSAGTIGKFSAYQTGESAISSIFFKIDFNTLPANGYWTFAIGNHSGGSTFFNNSSGVQATGLAGELFTALRWEIGSGNNMTFSYRKITGSTVNFHTLDNTPFEKGGSYNMEVYGNNSFLPENYIREGITYIVNPGYFHLWVNGVQLAVLPAADLESGEDINAFLFTGNHSTLPSANAATATLSNVKMHFVEESSLMSSGLLSFSDKQDEIKKSAENKVFKVFPNPVNDNMNLLYYSETSQEVNIKIVDMQGRILLTNTVFIIPGNNYIRMEATTLFPGMYVIYLSGIKIGEKATFIKH